MMWCAGRTVGSSNSSDCTFCEALLSITFLDTLQQPLHQEYITYRLSDFGQSWVFIKWCKDMWNSRKRRNYKMPPQGELKWELLTCLSPGGAQLWCTNQTCLCLYWLHPGTLSLRQGTCQKPTVLCIQGCKLWWGLRHVLGVESLLPSWCLFAGPKITNQTQLGW